MTRLVGPVWGLVLANWGAHLALRRMRGWGSRMASRDDGGWGPWLAILEGVNAFIWRLGTSGVGSVVWPFWCRSFPGRSISGHGFIWLAGGVRGVPNV